MTHLPGTGRPRSRQRDGAVMVYVPGGTFEMGSTEGDEDEQPVHTVTLDSFWLDKYQVTNQQYRKCVEAGECDPPTTCGSGEAFYEDESKADHPVVCVAWYGANTYCEWVEGRLPNEAEWEYAARGAEGNIYPWGNYFDCSRGNFDDEMQFNEYVVPGGAGCDGFDRTAPVGSFEQGASWCEALDMAGNVWEWVNDWYQEDYYTVSPDTNPTGPETGDYRVLRGGAWLITVNYARSANRLRYAPDSTTLNYGFRCGVSSTSSSP